jgi:hypothetical protein
VLRREAAQTRSPNDTFIPSLSKQMQEWSPGWEGTGLGQEAGQKHPGRIGGVVNEETAQPGLAVGSNTEQEEGPRGQVAGQIKVCTQEKQARSDLTESPQPGVQPPVCSSIHSTNID